MHHRVCFNTYRTINQGQGTRRSANASKYDVQGIIQYLQGLEDFIPEKYDGSYELVRETVNAYVTLSDYSNVDFRDLNLVYLMAVGIWKHSVEKKKETVNLSHLPDSEKARLIRVLDAVWAKAVAHEYEHSEACSKDFIKMWLISLQEVQKKSYSTIHTIRGVLRPAFRMAVEDDLIPKNPFDFELSKVIVNDSVTREAVSRKEERAFLKILRGSLYLI